MKNLSPLHQTPEEKLANSSQSSGETLREHSHKLDKLDESVQDLHQTTKGKNNDDIVNNQKETHKKLDELKDYIDHPEVVVRKLEEVKSAGLITNKLLKEVRDKKMPEFPIPEKFPEFPKFPTSMEVIIKGVEMLKGEKGDSIKGDSPTDEHLISLINPLIPKTKDGKTPTKNELLKIITPLIPKVENGYTPIKGKDYFDGEHGSPDTPDEVIEKVNQSKKKIDPNRIRGLDEITRQINEYGSNPQGIKEAGGGGNVVRFLSNGVVVSAYVTEINFSTNITPTYDGDGRITLTATGGGGTTYAETPTGLVNGSNKVYTTAHTITTVFNLTINGQFIHPAEYTVSGAGFTMGTALDASLSGTGFTIIYQ